MNILIKSNPFKKISFCSFIFMSYWRVSYVRFCWKIKTIFHQNDIYSRYIYISKWHSYRIKFHLYNDESQKWNSLQNFGQFYSTFQLKFVINWSTLNMFNDFSPFKMWKTKKTVIFYAISLPNLINIFKEQLVFHWTRNFSFHLFFCLKLMLTSSLCVVYALYAVMYTIDSIWLDNFTKEPKFYWMLF